MVKRSQLKIGKVFRAKKDSSIKNRDGSFMEGDTLVIVGVEDGRFYKYQIYNFSYKKFNNVCEDYFTNFEDIDEYTDVKSR